MRVLLHLCNMSVGKLLLLSCALFQAVASWAFADGIDRKLDAFLAIKPANPERWAHEGRSIYVQGLEQADCQKMLEGYGLLLAANGLDPEVEVPTWDDENCPRFGYYIPFHEGNRAFDSGEYARATLWYKRALESAETSEQRAKVKSNIGACFHLDGDLKRALDWMVAATEEGLEYMSPNSLNNISGLCISLGEFERALTYSTLAEDRLLEAFKSGMEVSLFVRYHDLMLLGQMASQLELNHPKEARETYERAHLEAFFEGVAAEFVHMAFLLAWEFDDPELIEMHANEFGAALMQDSLGAIERFGPVLGLLPPWRDAFDVGAQSIWAELRTLSPNQLPELPERRNDLGQVEANYQVKWFSILAGIWCVSGAAGLGIFGRRNKLKWKLSQGLGEGIAALRAGCDAHADEGERMKALSVLREIESRWRGQVLQVDFGSLTPREVDALRAAIAGERPKDSAERWGITARAVYSTRTSLREKLGVDKDTELDAWIKENWTA